MSSIESRKPLSTYGPYSVTDAGRIVWRAESMERSGVRPSVRPSVCPIDRQQQRRPASLLMGTLRTGDINSCGRAAGAIAFLQAVYTCITGGQIATAKLEDRE